MRANNELYSALATTTGHAHLEFNTSWHCPLLDSERAVPGDAPLADTFFFFSFTAILQIS
jgi:hypothetical protein